MIVQKTIRAAVVTISDTRALENDPSGNKLVELLVAAGTEVVERRVVTDDRSQISDVLESLADGGEIDLIVTTGGTGLSPRDNTPEATLDVLDRQAPGLSEVMRSETAAITPMAILSRGVSGVRGRTLIINLPGSPKGVEECFEVIKPILGHAVAQVRGDTAH